MEVTIGSGGRRRRDSRQPITAAAGRRQTVKNGRIDIRTFDWQRRNWDLIDRVGVVGFGMTLTQNTLSKAQIIPAILPNNPDEDPQPSTDPDEIALINAFRGPFGEAPELVATAGVNFQVAGEAYVLGTVDEGYDIVSSEQLQQLSHSVALRGADGSILRKLTDADYVARIWRAHPRFREMPHAPLTAAADDCLEWLLLSRRARGQLRTRLSAGYMFIPTEISPVKMQEFVTEEGEEAEDEFEEPYGANADADVLMEELISVMTRPLLDEDDLAGVVPWLLRGPGDQGQNIRQEPWRRSDEEQADSERRTELIKTIAGALDWPAEKVLGMGDSSYWNAWQIDQSAFEEHMDPGLRGVLRSLTIAWYRPMLMEMTGMTEEEARKRIMWRDLSAFQSEPDFESAAIAHERLVISDEALRKYGRFLKDDAPDEEELERRKPVVVVAPPEEESTPEGGAEPQDEEAEDVAASLVAAAELSSFPTPIERLAATLASIDKGLLTRITTAADRELNRALEKAGARMRSKTRNDPGTAAILKEIPNEMVGRHLGALYVRQQLQLEDGDLIPPGTFKDLEANVGKWIEQGQDAAASSVETFTGQVERDPEREEEGRNAAVEMIGGLLAGLALSRLFTSAPAPDVQGEVPNTTVPPHQVMDALTVAGGGSTLAPEGNLFDQGIGNGTMTREWMESSGFFTEGYMWDYGDPSSRMSNFEPHRALDGIQFQSWEEPALTRTGSWPAVAHFFPQDHGGCLCSYQRIFCETILAAGDANPCGPPQLGAALTNPPEWKATMSRQDADAFAKGSEIEFDLFHGLTPEQAVAVRRDGFQISQLGKSSGNGGLMGAGHYFAPTAGEAYGARGATLTVKARVNKIAYWEVGSTDALRAEALAKVASNGSNRAVREAMRSEGGLFDQPYGGSTLREIVGDASDEYLDKLADVYSEAGTYGREMVQRQVLMDEGYDAIVWRNTANVNPSLPEEIGSWREIAIFRDDAIVVVDELAEVAA